jgi:hypothetical protein
MRETSGSAPPASLLSTGLLPSAAGLTHSSGDIKAGTATWLIVSTEEKTFHFCVYLGGSTQVLLAEQKGVAVVFSRRLGSVVKFLNLVFIVRGQKFGRKLTPK